MSRTHSGDPYDEPERHPLRPCRFARTPLVRDAVNAGDSWTAERMIQLRQVGGVHISPDTTKVVYVVRRAVMDGDKSEFVARIHVVNHDGTGDYPLTQAEYSSDGPQWSPDGERSRSYEAVGKNPGLGDSCPGGEARR